MIIEQPAVEFDDAAALAATAALEAAMEAQSAVDSLELVNEGRWQARHALIWAASSALRSRSLTGEAGMRLAASLRASSVALVWRLQCCLSSLRPLPRAAGRLWW